LSANAPPRHPTRDRAVTPVVRALLIANVAAFFLQRMLPGFGNAFVLVPAYLLVRPWTLVTYMFLHGGLGHLFFNMLALFFFGPRVEERIGSRPFTWLYFLSGIGGALLSFLFAPMAGVIGASGAVFGVTLAFAYYWPHTQILIWGIVPVPARILVIVYGVISLFSGITGSRDGVAHFAHLGGYVGAFLYLKWLERSRTSFRRKAVAPPPAADARLSGWRAVDTTKVHDVNRAEVDRILDKISAKGLGSLTPQERTFLSHFVPPDDRVPPPQ
jgi:membrane associated rhomboid family serine protease